MELQERLYYQWQINSLFPYLRSAFQKKGEWKCKACGVTENLEIDHLRYGDDITINDLQVLCYGCHSMKTGVTNELRLSGDFCSYCQRPY